MINFAVENFYQIVPYKQSEIEASYWSKRNPKDSEIAFSGGGIKNLSLMALIKNKLSGRHIQSTTDWGIAPEWVEAAGFAFLAHQRMQAKPVELTKTTGSKKKSILGAIYLPPQ